MASLYRIVTGIVVSLACALSTGNPSYASQQQARLASSWLQGWPMEGHDPQRTSRSPDVGPLHPHLLFTHANFRAEIIGPDGSIYGWAPSQTEIVALDASGRQRWVLNGCCEEGYPALAPDGMLFDTGGLSPDDSGVGNSTVAIAIKPDGSVAWRIDPFGVAKGAISLVTPDNLFYAPVIGPHNGTGSEPYIGLNIVSPDGQVLHHVAQTFAEPAVGQNGTIYDGTPLRAVDPNGKLLWQHKAVGASIGPLVGRHGTIYIASGTMLAAYTSAGRLRWKLHWPDNALALAERANGTLLVAGWSKLGAVSASGKPLWRVRIGKATEPYNRRSLVVDAAGTSYVGGSDSKLRIIAKNGTLISTLPVGPHPTGILGPNGRLIVSGADGVLRVYGP